MGLQPCVVKSCRSASACSLRTTVSSTRMHKTPEMNESAGVIKKWRALSLCCLLRPRLRVLGTQQKFSGAGRPAVGLQGRSDGLAPMMSSY